MIPSKPTNVASQAQTNPTQKRLGFRDNTMVGNYISILRERGEGGVLSLCEGRGWGSTIFFCLAGAPAPQWLVSRLRSCTIQMRTPSPPLSATSYHGAAFKQFSRGRGAGSPALQRARHLRERLQAGQHHRLPRQQPLRIHRKTGGPRPVVW